MSAETLSGQPQEAHNMPFQTETGAPQYTESQKTYQRLLRVKTSEPQNEVAGDKLKKVALHAGVFAAGTMVDLGESYIFTKYVLEPSEHFIKTKVENQKTAVGLIAGGEFVEEWGSDAAYMAGMNYIAQSLTGVEGAIYVSPTAEVLADWANVISQVFMRKPDMTWKQKSENWINPVNTEAGFRLLEEIPVVGKGVEMAHGALDHALEHSPWLQNVNKAAGKFLTGYHIFKNVVK